VIWGELFLWELRQHRRNVKEKKQGRRERRGLLLIFIFLLFGLALTERGAERTGLELCRTRKGRTKQTEVNGKERRKREQEKERRTSRCEEKRKREPEKKKKKNKEADRNVWGKL
jgi:hypothetical protein